MNVGDTVTFVGLEGREHAAEVVAVHPIVTLDSDPPKVGPELLDLRIVGRTGEPLKRISRDDSPTPHPFTWRPA